MGVYRAKDVSQRCLCPKQRVASCDGTAPLSWLVIFSSMPLRAVLDDMAAERGLKVTHGCTFVSLFSPKAWPSSRRLSEARNQQRQWTAHALWWRARTMRCGVQPGTVTEPALTRKSRRHFRLHNARRTACAATTPASRRSSSTRPRAVAVSLTHRTSLERGGGPATALPLQDRGAAHSRRGCT
jgi:hypothetical protein